MAEPTLTRTDEIFLIDFGEDENVTSEPWTVRMGELLDEVEAADGPKALVTTASSAKHYSNGLDVPYMADLEGGDLIAYVSRVETIVRRIMLLGAPTAAAINGHAFGMGAFLAIAHDQAVMREDRGYLCFPEVHLNMSFPPSLMSAATAALSPQTRRFALAAGHRYSGPEAVAADIVNSSAPLDDLVQLATERVAPLTGTAGNNLAFIKAQLFPDVVKHLGEG